MEAGRGKLTLLVQKDDTFKTLELQYAGGERYPNLVREPGSADLLAQHRAPARAPAGTLDPMASAAGAPCSRSY